MANYKKMYHLLFNKITDIIGELQELQQQAEKIYMEQDDQIINLTLLKNEKEDSNLTILKK